MQTFNEGSTITLELDKDETLARHILQAAISRAILDPNLWAVYLIIEPELANVNKDLLLELGFLYAGNLSRGNKTFLKLKRHIKTSGESGSGSDGLAVPTPMLPSSDFERAAQRLMVERYGRKE